MFLVKNFMVEWMLVSPELSSWKGLRVTHRSSESGDIHIFGYALVWFSYCQVWIENWMNYDWRIMIQILIIVIGESQAHTWTLGEDIIWRHMILRNMDHFLVCLILLYLIRRMNESLRIQWVVLTNSVIVRSLERGPFIFFFGLSIRTPVRNSRTSRFFM